MAIRRKFNPWTRTFDYINKGSATEALAVFIQPLEPTLASNKSIGMWEDTTSGRKLLIYKDNTGAQTLVELT